jgi:hypothetical protein
MHNGIVLVEAESFSDLGGWVVDQQFMDQMGSPYLLAHGLGAPVKDANTIAEFSNPGKYRVWVRTKDWVAPWNAPGAPGKFQLVVDRKALETVFGTEGADWHWQDGGIVEIKNKKVKIALHDLTGFEGRCDAVLFCSDAKFAPPNGTKELAGFRRKALGFSDKSEDAGNFDFVVAGGGIAGICAAVSAARNGLKTALLHDRPVLGGNNSSEVRVWLGGDIKLQPYPQIGNLVNELEPKNKAHGGPENKAELYEDEKRENLLRNEKNLCLFLDCRANEILMDGNSIKQISAINIRTGKKIIFKGKLFADCTGDGQIGFLAGADFETTAVRHMGASNLWSLVETKNQQNFPGCPWAVDLSEKPFPGRGGRTAQWHGTGLDLLGVWFWESGFNRHPVDDMELTRDWNFRAMYGAWDALKNTDKVYPNHKLNWAAYISGRRESRRLLGDVLLTENDIVSGRKFEDGCFPCTWGLDIHTPHPEFQKGFEGQEFISEAVFGEFKKPFWAPYRCLYSKNIANLFMAGRNISVTHTALGTVRVMRTTGMMGEVVGMAASLCVKNKINPGGIYEKHLEEFKELMKKGIGK